MLTKLEKPLRMTVDEAQKKFYPNSYVMVNCEWESGLIEVGEVVAYAPQKNNGGTLLTLADELQDSGKYGEVMMGHTKDPLDGGSLLIEYYDTDQ
jgi:translation elongation factor EF-1alpha